MGKSQTGIKAGAGDGSPVCFRLKPSGHLHGSGGSAGAAAAFVRGAGAGLLHLGLVETTEALEPQSAFWRDLGRLFVERFCADAAPEEGTGKASSFDPASVEPPREALEGMADAAPPMVGGEYLSVRVLERLWREIAEAMGEELSAFDGTVQDFLRVRNPVWNTVGRVHFHLAERKGDPERPFAFMATYTTRVGAGGKARHVPLGQALKDYAGEGRAKALLSLLRPVHEAARRSELVRELVDSGGVFHPMAWTAGEAYRFLRELPAMEAGGVVARVPNWWGAAAPRPRVRVTVGSKEPAGVGMAALLDFRVDVALGGEALSREELEEILAAREGLALVRGRWVEVDREKLAAVLERWESLEDALGDGMSFGEAMRMLSGLEGGAGALEEDEGAIEDWTQRVAGPWLAERLAALRRPGEGRGRTRWGGLRGKLRPYQRTGARWLWTLRGLGLGGCLADDMGLGKTIQVLALLCRIKAEGGAGPSLVVVPASLLANWRAEGSRFAPKLSLLVAHPSEANREDLAALGPEAVADYDAVVTSYGYVKRLKWAQEVSWDTIILDEAQAIKNAGTGQARAVKALRGGVRLALTGTPVENRLEDLWSIFDFLNPGLLGSARAFKGFLRGLREGGKGNYGPLRRLVAPYILRRLKSDKAVICDLPEKTEVKAYCRLTRVQASLYAEAVEDLASAVAQVEGMKRRGLVLAMLTRLKQICNHPSHWLGDGDWSPGASGKFARLRELAESFAARQEKVLVFTQYREATAPLADFLASIYGRAGVVLHGGTPVKRRQLLVESFQDEEGPPFFVLSLKAGGTGLNLTAASHVIHFDRWWNPAVENQATDRAYRIGQTKKVLVHKFVCRGTVEERIDAMLESKRATADAVLSGGGATMLTEMGDEELLRTVALDIRSAGGEN